VSRVSGLSWTVTNGRVARGTCAVGARSDERIEVTCQVLLRERQHREKQQADDS